MLIQPLLLHSPRIQQDEFLRRAMLELDAQIALVIEDQTSKVMKKVVTK